MRTRTWQTLLLLVLIACSKRVDPPVASPAATGPIEVEVRGVARTDLRATSEGGPVSLFGPFELPEALREWAGPLRVHLDDLTFAAGTGNSALFYIVDASQGPSDEVHIDETCYIGSAANVSGMATGPMGITLEINDGDATQAPRTKLRGMRSFLLAMVVTRGAVHFERAVLSTRDASDRADTVVFYDTPNAEKAAAMDGAQVRLYGPLELPARLRETDELLYLVLDGVTFPPETAVNALIYLVDGSASPITIDQTNYITGLGNVVGMDTGPLRSMNTIHDYDVDGTPHRPRTRLKTMASPMIALVITDGDMKFARASITTRKPVAP